MSTPIQPGDRPVAITATWVVTVGPGWTMDALSERWWSNPTRMLSGLDVTERTPVTVSARPAHDLFLPDTAGEPPAAPVDRPLPPDLFFGPELAGEALRRIAEADRYHQRAMRLADEPVTTSIEDDPSECAEHMRVTALALSTLAGVAARLGPDFGGRADRFDGEWTAALSAVAALIPVPAEEQVDEALVDAVQAGGAAAWQQHHGTSSGGDEDLRETVHGLLSGLGGRAREARQQSTSSGGDETGDGAR